METISSLPPLQTLRAMAAVYATRSFTQAGAQLGLTQTAVSHQIAGLEKWLGAKLFIRSRAGVELTVEGEHSIPAMVEALKVLEASVEAARPSVKSQDLRVSTTPEFATQWLQPRLGSFCAAHPEIDVSVTIEYRRARFDQEPIGVAVWLAGTLPDAIQLSYDYEFVVCSPQVAKQLPEREALRAAPLLRYEGSRHTVLDWERWHGQLYNHKAQQPAIRAAVDFNAGPSYPTFQDMIAACKADAGLALVRTSLVADELAAGRLVKAFVETTRSDLQYHLVTSPKLRRRSDVIAFRSWILGEMSHTG